MSAIHRSLARLPLDVFTNLITRPEEGPRDPEVLRDLVYSKLKHMVFQTKSGFGSTDGVTTVGQLLKLSPPALLRAVDPILTNEECEELVRRICYVCAATPCSALSLLRATVDASTVDKEPDDSNRMRHLPSGMQSLDACLRGGFRIGTITELVGRAGVGKTQLALQLCVMAARYGQGSVYIDTEKKISLSRLKEMAHERATAFNSSDSSGAYTASNDVGNGVFFYGGHNGTSDTHLALDDSQRHSAANDMSHMAYKNAHDVLENVTVHSPGSTQELLSVVSGGVEEEILLRNQDALESSKTFPVRLVILDSIAASTRRDFGAESAPQRVSALFQVAQMLKRIADQLQVAVVVINQVGLMGDNASANNFGSTEDGSDFVAVTAALGTSWHHCVSSRLLLEHERDPHRLKSAMDDAHERSAEQNEGLQSGPLAAWMSVRGHVRTATVVKSNVAGMSRMAFEVTTMGLCELREQS